MGLYSARDCSWYFSPMLPGPLPLPGNAKSAIATMTAAQKVATPQLPTILGQIQPCSSEGEVGEEGRGGQQSHQDFEDTEGGTFCGIGNTSYSSPFAGARAPKGVPAPPRGQHSSFPPLILKEAMMMIRSLEISLRTKRAIFTQTRTKLRGTI